MTKYLQDSQLDLFVELWHLVLEHTQSPRGVRTVVPWGGRGEEGRQLGEGCTSQLRKGSLSLYPVAETLLFTF